MKLYIDNLIPRLKDFSASLDKKEIFIEKPWIFVDSEGNLQKYIFRRNGELVMSLQGKVTSGKWEYIPAAKSLLIDRISDKILLNQNFIDPAVMILKMDGLNGGNFILANEELLPSLNVDDYLKKLYYQKNSISILKFKQGFELEVFNNGVTAKSKVSIEGEPVPDSILEHLTEDRKYIIRDSRIFKILVNQIYKTRHGIITIGQEQYYEACVGDSVFLDNSSVPNGKYKLGFMHFIQVKDGIIRKITKF